MRFLKENVNNTEEIVELYYDNLPIEYQSNYYLDYWNGPQWESEDIEIKWVYEVNKNDILDVILDEVVDEMYKKYPDRDDFTDKEVEEYFEDNYDELFNKYEKTILDHFEDKAIRDAEENYERD